MEKHSHSGAGCSDFHATAERRKREQSGGTRVSRRRLLQVGIGASALLYGTQNGMPLSRMLEAAEAEAAATPNAPVIVSIFLAGGLDPLDTLVPMNEYDKYAALHPTLKLEQPLPLPGSTDFALNPALGEGLGGGIRGLFEAGKFAFLPGVNYPNYDLSHFASRGFYEKAVLDLKASPGWLGRYLDAVGGQDNPFQGVSFSGGLSPVLRSARVPVAAVSSPNSSQVWMPGTWDDSYKWAMQSYSKLSQARSSGSAERDSAYGAARRFRYVAEKLEPYTYDEGKEKNPLAPSVEYPKQSNGKGLTGFAENLSNVAALISLPLGIKAVTIDGPSQFDTHDDQETTLAQELRSFSTGMASFQADLEARGIADRVLTFVWSEFGRRPTENASGGTDHGDAGMAFVMGKRVRSGVLTEYPSLAKLDRKDNLIAPTDFRAIYSSLLEQWLGMDAARVIPGAGGLGRVQLLS